MVDASRLTFPEPALLDSERSFLDSALASAPSKRALDLGCGSGRHARFLADRGWDVVALDASQEAIARAQAEPGGDRVEFLVRDMGTVEGAVRGHFGAAVCLGNALAHLLTPESVSRMLVGLRRRLLPGSPLLLEVLNYNRVIAGTARSLPIERHSVEGKSLLTMELVEPRPDGVVHHTEALLEHRANGDPILEVVTAKQDQLRGWTRSELEVMLDVARFPIRGLFGDLSGGEFDAATSRNLILLAG